MWKTIQTVERQQLSNKNHADNGQSLTGATLIAADKFYAVIKGKELLAAHQLASDPVRAELDEFVLKELLKINAANLKAWLGMVATLRKKLGSEPSFNGGK